MSTSAKKRLIVTFKPKDQRPERTKDKLEIVRQTVEQAPRFFDATTLAAGAAGLAAEPEAFAYDVNHYDAPIVIGAFTAVDAEALRKNPNVAAVEEDGPIRALGAGPQLLIEGQPSVLAETVPAGVAQIKAVSAWDATRGLDIRVAVLDTGIDGSHPDLAPNYRGGVSFVAGEPTPQDFNGHGTHCAGTIAAAINGSGVVGVAPAASLYAVKVLDRTGSGAWSNLIAGIDWAIRNGMQILSMSLGADAAPAAVGTMCQNAWNRGLLLVAAAGNNGGAVGFPAAYPAVIAVSAIDNANNLAGFSSRGPKVELAAPGVNVLSTLPGNRYGALNGTSMATPHVSGAAALAWSTHRYSNNVTIRRLLAWTADNLGAPGRDPLFGFGRVDADQATRLFASPPAIPGIP